jgi:hypothetical protein
MICLILKPISQLDSEPNIIMLYVF